MEYKVKDAGRAIRDGVDVSKQIRVSVKSRYKAKHFRNNASLEALVWKVIKENKPPNKVGERIEWQTTMQYKTRAGMTLKVSDEFSRERFSLQMLNSMHIRSVDYDDYDVFDWGFREAIHLDKVFYISYKYVDFLGNGLDGGVDCLLDCLTTALDGLTKDETKKFREIIPEGSGVKVDELSKIEEKLEVNINVFPYYESDMIWPRTVDMTLFNKHYELAKEDGCEILPCDKEQTRLRIVLRNDHVIGQMTKKGYVMETIDDARLEELKSLNKYKKIWMIEVIEEPTHELWKQYSEFDSYMFRKYGITITAYNTLAKFAVGLWRRTLKQELRSARLMDDAILDCLSHSGSALVDIKDGEGASTMYDYNSFYPSLLTTAVQVGCPKWGDESIKYKYMLNEEERKKYGRDYFLRLRCGWFHIEIDELELCKEFPKRFMKASSGYYYYKELQEMDRLGYKYQLTSKRAIIMDSDRSVLFKEFYTELYDYKVSSKNVVCKKVMNSLLGKLASKSYSVRQIKDGGDVSLKETEDVCSSSESVFITKNYRLSKYRYMPWLQAKVFAEGRVKMNETIDKMGRDKVLAVQTDSIVMLNGGVEPSNVSGKMGDLKICNVGYIKIQDGKKEWSASLK